MRRSVKKIVCVILWIIALPSDFLQSQPLESYQQNLLARWDALMSQASRPTLEQTHRYLQPSDLEIQNPNGVVTLPFHSIKWQTQAWLNEVSPLVFQFHKVATLYSADLAFVGRDMVHLYDLFSALRAEGLISYDIHWIGVSGDSFSDSKMGPKAAVKFLNGLGFRIDELLTQRPWVVVDLASGVSGEKLKWMRQIRYMTASLAAELAVSLKRPDLLGLLGTKWISIGLIENRSSFHNSEKSLNRDLVGVDDAWQDVLAQAIEVNRSTFESFSELARNDGFYPLFDRIWTFYQFLQVKPLNSIFQFAQQREGLLWHEKFRAFTYADEQVVSNPGPLLKSREMNLAFQVYLKQSVQLELEKWRELLGHLTCQGLLKP